MKPKGLIVWSKESHYRFKRGDRLCVRVILWCAKQVIPRIDKNVWINHIIVHTIRAFIMPDLVVYNLPFNTTAEELINALNQDIDCAEIVIRRNGKSKGCRYVSLLHIRTMRYDDFEILVGTQKFYFNGHGLTFLMLQ